MSIVQTKKRGFEGRKVWFAFAAIAALLTAVGFFVILSSVTSTTTYYVLNQNVAARTEITSSMLSPVVTSTGGQPQNALGLADITANPTYAKYALNTGDLLTTSNSGSLTPLNTGLPAGFVVATFTAPASAAVGGTIARGDYIDLIDISSSTNSGIKQASYFLQHVLVLDATVNLDSVASGSNSAPTSATGSTVSSSSSSSTANSSVRSGIPTMYTVGLSPQDAAKLAIATQETIYVVLSADQTSGSVVPDINISVDVNSLSGQVGDSGVGTDNTFSGKAKGTNSTTSGSAPAPSSTPSTSQTPVPTSTSSKLGG